MKITNNYKCLCLREIIKKVMKLFILAKYARMDENQSNASCFDLQHFIETKLKSKYNLTSTTIFFEVINLNEGFVIDLNEEDIRKVKLNVNLGFLSIWAYKEYCYLRQ